MDSHTRSWIEVVREDGKNGAGNLTSDAKFEEHIANGKLTYGGFISILQSLGVAHHSVRGNRYGVPIGKGQYFSVYRHLVSANDSQAMNLSISIPGQDLFQRPILRPNTCVAIKRINVREDAEEIDVSEPGQLYAISREITALLNSKLREHDSIIKLQAIIWEHGHGAGYANGSPLWPSLVMEYCDTTLAAYQLLNPRLIPLHSATLCQKIGDGLDAIHSVNIFHGDLKAENVLLRINQSGAPEPKLADFGCSIIFLDKTGKTKYYVSGTELWWAPEVRIKFSLSKNMSLIRFSAPVGSPPLSKSQQRMNILSVYLCCV
jgi:serine/threonine protein kinase